jgi:hypothetical protein
MNTSTRMASALTVCVLMVLAAYPKVAQAQNSNEDQYRKYATIPTEVPGIYTFAQPPQGFNPLAASSQELAMYGLPPAPDKVASPDAYQAWANNIKAATSRWRGPLKITEHHSVEPSKARAAQVSSQVVGPIAEDSLSWSGFSNSKNISAYSSKRGPLSSIYAAYATFNVPILVDSFGQSGCSSANGTSGTVAVSVGIDAPALQGGIIANNPGWTDSGSCVVGTPTYYAEIGAGTSSSIISEFSVNPGDVISVVVWDTSATSGFVYIADATQNISATYAITTTPIIAASADFLITRVDTGDGLDALPNYVADFWSQVFAIDFSDDRYGPGTNSSGTTNVQWEMTDDAGDQVISIAVPFTLSFKNSIVTRTTYSLYFSAQNCALNGGCTP